MARAVLTSFYADVRQDDGTESPQHVYLVADLDSGQVTATTDPFVAYPHQKPETEGTDH